MQFSVNLNNLIAKKLLFHGQIKSKDKNIRYGRMVVKAYKIHSNQEKSTGWIQGLKFSNIMKNETRSCGGWVEKLQKVRIMGCLPMILKHTNIQTELCQSNQSSYLAGPYPHYTQSMCLVISLYIFHIRPM